MNVRQLRLRAMLFPKFLCALALWCCPAMQLLSSEHTLPALITLQGRLNEIVHANPAKTGSKTLDTSTYQRKISKIDSKDNYEFMVSKIKAGEFTVDMALTKFPFIINNNLLDALTGDDYQNSATYQSYTSEAQSILDRIKTEIIKLRQKAIEGVRSEGAAHIQ